jgi:hypothetical protein
MTAFTVTTAADVVNPGDGRLSLREAVAQANANGAGRDTIKFAAALEGRTLLLTGGQLAITGDAAVDGDRDDDGTGVTLSGGQASRVLSVGGDGTDVGLRDLTLTQGSSPAGESGGAILLGGGGTLALVGCTVRDSVSNGESFEGGDGGGIYADGGGRVAIVASTFVGNQADFDGGGVGTGYGAELVIRGSSFSGNFGGAAGYSSRGGGISVGGYGSLTLEDSRLFGNGRATGDEFFGAEGGALHLGFSGVARIARCSISGNEANLGGAIATSVADFTVTDSTLAGNSVYWSSYSGSGGAIRSFGGTLVLRNSTVTGNVAVSGVDNAGGGIEALGTFEVANSIVAGNAVFSRFGDAEGPDVAGVVARSDGHNVFGTDVDGATLGDREGVPAVALFATVDPQTGGGLPDPRGIVLLRDDVANPALSGADPLAAMPTGQLGTARPQPAGGRVEGDRDGGGVFVGTGSSLALTGCTVRDCESGSYGYDGSGGGIFAEGGSRLTVAGSSILGNSTTGDGGGGIAAHGNVALVVRNSELSGNSAYYAAGAIQLNGGTLVMEGSRLSGNVAGGEYANGGALDLVDSTATIARSTISGNSANDGGGLFASGGRVSLSDSTIADNHVGSYTASGGGIAGSGLLVVRNSTITGNTIPYGYSSGGIDGVELDIANSIVAGNVWSAPGPQAERCSVR